MRESPPGVSQCSWHTIMPISYATFLLAIGAGSVLGDGGTQELPVPVVLSRQNEVINSQMEIKAVF